MVTSDGGMETDTIFDKESVLCLGLILVVIGSEKLRGFLGGTILTEGRIVESFGLFSRYLVILTTFRKTLAGLL